MQSFSASWPAWPNGVWPEVVGQRDRLDQVFVQPQRPRDRAPQLRHLQRMRQARAEQVAFVVQEHLGLVDQAPEGRRMDDAVAIALEVGARGRRRLPGGGGRATARDRRRRRARRHGPDQRRVGQRGAARHSTCARTSRTSGRDGTHAGVAGRLDDHEADLAGLGLLVDAHQLEVALGAQRRRRRTGRPAARDQRGQALARTRRRCSPSRCDRCAAITMPQPTASPCSHSP